MKRKGGLPFFTDGASWCDIKNRSGQIVSHAKCMTCPQFATKTLHTGTDNLFRFPFCEKCSKIIYKSITKYWENKKAPLPGPGINSAFHS